MIENSDFGSRHSKKRVCKSGVDPVHLPIPNPEINQFNHMIQFRKAENSVCLKNKLCPIRIVMTRK